VICVGGTDLRARRQQPVNDEQHVWKPNACTGARDGDRMGTGRRCEALS